MNKNLIIMGVVGLVIVGGIMMFNKPKEDIVSEVGEVVPTQVIDSSPSSEMANINEPIYLSCDNNYDLSLSYHNPDEDGIMREVSVMGTDGEKMIGYEMIPAISASGAKFQTEDGVFTLWEHQGTFELSENDQVIATCIEAQN